MNTKKILGTIVVVTVVGLGIFAVYQKITSPQALETAAAPSVVGGLVSITTTTLTVKAADGTQRDFQFSSKTPVISRVQEGEVGKIVSQLSIGDVLAVTADVHSTAAQKIEILPISESPSMGGQPPFTFTGAIVSVSSSSIVVKSLVVTPLPDPINADRTVFIAKNTEVLTQVLGAQTGKSLDAVAPGSVVTVMGTSTAGGIHAKTIIVLLSNNQ